MQVAYSYGVYDILRAKDLRDLDKTIQMSKEKGNEAFGLGIYDSSLCQVMGTNEPLKSLEDRMQIMKQIRGVDFVFPLVSLDKNIIRKEIEEEYSKFLEKLNGAKENQPKKYDIGYAPGTYDLFHAGHLENLMIAAEQCNKLIVGVKSDELVQEQKHKTPIISAEERMEILRHFKFVHDVYLFHTRGLHIANDWIKSKYGKDVDAVFVGDDLKKDYGNVKGINVVYTPRPPELMSKRSSSAYRKLHLSRISGKFTGNILNDLAKDIEEER